MTSISSNDKEHKRRKTASSGARTLDRGLAILDVLAQVRRAIGVTEIAEQLHLDKSTVHRLLSTLAKRGYVQQKNDSRHYMLGPQVLALYDAFQEHVGLQQLCRPMLEALTALSQETSHLAILSGVDIVFLDYISTPQMMGVRTMIGRREPAYCTALGRALLAALPRDKRIELLEETTFQAYTERTPMSLPAVNAILDASEEKGWALDNEEFLAGVRCLASVIVDGRGQPVAAIGISGPAARLSEKRCHELGPRIHAIALGASAQLGYPKP